MYGDTEEIFLEPSVPQLFLDDKVIDTASGITAVQHVAERVPADATGRSGASGVNERAVGNETAFADDAQYCYETGLSREIHPDRLDEPGTVISQARVGKYAGTHLAMLKAWDRESGRIGAQLASSRDGVRWTRCFRKPLYVLDTGDDIRADALILEYPTVRADRILLSCGYAGGVETVEVTYGLRRDGWVSLDAGDHRGALVTKVMRYPESGRGELRLVLNVRVNAGGFLTVRILDEHGAPWSGYRGGSVALSDPVAGDSVLLPVTWNGAGEIDSRDLCGRRFRLRIDMRSASLFSFGLQERRTSAPVAEVASKHAD